MVFRETYSAAFLSESCFVFCFLVAGDACEAVVNLNPSQTGKRLVNHVAESGNVTSEESCQILCFMNAEICRSINFKKTKDKNGKHLCEVNNSTATKHHKDLKTHAEFDYQEGKVGRQLLLRLADQPLVTDPRPS